MKPVTNKLDLRVTLLVNGMAISFLCIHTGDATLSMPVLVWAAAGTVMSPVPYSIPCLLVSVSWLLLWRVAFDASAQNGRFFSWCSFSLWLTVIFLIASHLMSQSIHQGLWFWLPCLAFTLCSLSLVQLIYITKYVE